MPPLMEVFPRKVSNLYVRNLHQNTSENDLMNLFAFGGSVTVLRVRRFKDFAFVHYDTRTEAEKALSKTSKYFHS